jgi:hypothetical protein
MGDSALPFTINQSVDNVWGVTYLYGCTALMISDPKFVIGTHHGPCHKPHPTIVSFTLLLLMRYIVAHMQQETGTGTICINDQTSLNNWLANTLQPALDLVKSPSRYRFRLRGLMLMVVQ